MFDEKGKLFSCNPKKCLQIIISSCICAYTSTSVLLHLGILQNFTLYEKVLLIFIVAFPFFWLLNLFYITFHHYHPVFLTFILAFMSFNLLIIFYTSNSYKQIVPVKTHTIAIYYPKENNGQIYPTFTIQKIEISNSITRSINPYALRLVDFDISPNDTGWFHPGSLLKTSIEYSGNLSFFPSTTSCPLLVEINSDDLSWTQDLCKTDPKNGIVIGFDDYGQISEKWGLLIRYVKILDFVTLLVMIFVILFTCSALFFTRKTFLRERRVQDHSPVLLLLLDSLILVAFLLLTILTTSFTWIPGFISSAILLVMDIVFKSNDKTRLFKAIMEFGFPVMILFVSILNLVGKNELLDYVIPPMTTIEDTSDKSLNLIVNRVFGFASKDLLFGYDEVLFDRNLILPSSGKMAGFYVENQDLSQANFKGVVYQSYENEISADQFETILAMKHSEWNDKFGNHLILLDMSYYQGMEPIRFLIFENYFLFVPSSMEIIGASDN